MDVAMQQRQLVLDGQTPLGPSAQAVQSATSSASSPPPRSPGGAGTDTNTDVGADSGDAGSATETPTLSAVHAFVERHIAPLVRKTTTTGEGGGIRWCRQWWRHIDAVHRFTALLIVWTELSHQDDLTWLSGYYRDHLDPHLATLTSPFGPFHACTPLRHSDVIEPLGHTALTTPLGAAFAAAQSVSASPASPTPSTTDVGVGLGTGGDGGGGSGGGPGAGDGRFARSEGHTATTPAGPVWPAGGQTGRRPR
jgi:hypothetical protein